MRTVELVLLTIGVQGGLLLAGILLGWYLEIPVWGRTHFLVYDIVLGTLIGLVMTFFSIGLLKLPLRMLDPLRRDAAQAMGLLGKLSVPLILFVSIAAGVSEEVFFRGVLQVYLSDALGLYSGIFLASVIFGLLHFVSVSYVTYVIIFGCLFGLVYVWTGNLLIVIIAHLVYDFAILVWGIHIRKDDFISS